MAATPKDDIQALQKQISSVLESTETRSSNMIKAIDMLLEQQHFATRSDLIAFGSKTLPRIIFVGVDLPLDQNLEPSCRRLAEVDSAILDLGRDICQSEGVDIDRAMGAIICIFLEKCPPAPELNEFSCMKSDEAGLSIVSLRKKECEAFWASVSLEATQQSDSPLLVDKLLRLSLFHLADKDVHDASAGSIGPFDWVGDAMERAQSLLQSWDMFKGDLAWCQENFQGTRKALARRIKNLDNKLGQCSMANLSEVGLDMHILDERLKRMTEEADKQATLCDELDNWFQEQDAELNVFRRELQVQEEVIQPTSGIMGLVLHRVASVHHVTDGAKLYGSEDISALEADIVNFCNSHCWNRRRAAAGQIRDAMPTSWFHELEGRAEARSFNASEHDTESDLNAEQRLSCNGSVASTESLSSTSIVEGQSTVECGEQRNGFDNPTESGEQISVERGVGSDSADASSSAVGAPAAQGVITIIVEGRRATRCSESYKVWYETCSHKPLPCVPDGVIPDLSSGHFFLNQVTSKAKFQLWVYDRNSTWTPLHWGQKIEERWVVLTDTKNHPSLVKSSTWKRYEKMTPKIIIIKKDQKAKSTGSRTRSKPELLNGIHTHATPALRRRWFSKTIYPGVYIVKETKQLSGYRDRGDGARLWDEGTASSSPEPRVEGGSGTGSRRVWGVVIGKVHVQRANIVVLGYRGVPSLISLIVNNGEKLGRCSRYTPNPACQAQAQSSSETTNKGHSWTPRNSKSGKGAPAGEGVEVADRLGIGAKVAARAGVGVKVASGPLVGVLPQMLLMSFLIQDQKGASKKHQDPVGVKIAPGPAVDVIPPAVGVVTPRPGPSPFSCLLFMNSAKDNSFVAGAGVGSSSSSASRVEVEIGSNAAGGTQRVEWVKWVELRFQVSLIMLASLGQDEVLSVLQPLSLIERVTKPMLR
ncbi:hypothetical protein BJ165DRAFT_1410379 [Panaeolus papilionaceus]|nr:hypothetical protein BJ165DRAFT_1410379 [Panaeolus papilionaceus]